MKLNDLDPAQHAARRARLAQAMQGGVAVIPTAPERIRNRDAHYPYRFDSYFYYLTGFAEPEAVLVLVAGAQPQKHPVLPREECRARDLGRLPLRPEAAREELRLRRGLPDRTNWTKNWPS